jgi:hypothetical protein
MSYSNGTSSSLIIYGTSSTIKIKNAGTGELLEFDTDSGSRRVYRFKRMCGAFMDIATELDLSIYFLTFTLRTESSTTITKEISKILDVLKHRFKRSGLPMFYVWVVELQKKRYKRTGVKALHWHIALAVPDGSMPDVEFVQSARIHYRVRSEGSVVDSAWLFKRWGRGQVLSMLANTGVFGYLVKYLEKDMDDNVSWNDSIRRYGGSQYGYRVYPAWGREKILALKSEGVPVDSMYLRKRGGLIQVLAKNEKWTDGRLPMFKGLAMPDMVRHGVVIKKKRECEAIKYDLIYSFRSPWLREGLTIDKIGV